MAPAPRALTLILGGARSGKSRFAEDLALRSGLARTYVATAQPFDDEMAERIAHHRERRDGGWTTVDAPSDLATALAASAGGTRIVLVDCLTLWLSNVMLAGRDVEAAIDELVTGVSLLTGPAILVSNEVGSGIVPENALGRAFRDHQGRLNQRVAAVADRVTLVVAGLPLDLKLPKEP
ncbi:bifunctional adenosylcobinamide kinase/adenosylcobinamide-phosphate guanylyltransferase [Chenggangzhangella methanolivorans]|uniref:Bifunctional adenosylcobalamin biosynthesis protein n=1 Tax=Chenggangzhangella methanolivorans TaxID=1437009 RepID=A0A9E6R8R7_9HYPH|nr:bifunctional adenosylcobinamide kinase/adenosylcobinamide-phosphate guanylyltransferase [Chenggangzhangella methanolivorans]QZO00134.1 bifunctional adenosylcobinamide kinase/adenosylcobinamide-phosphate guanylyltransferase [Chenggangzhangella methanolivorans]